MNLDEPIGPVAPSGAPVIPDHEMLRRIGGGSYGEVWLARNVIGAYRAVKIVHRSTFSDARPFDREFNGIQKFEPISRSHPGLIQVLQVGRNVDAGYFYYVMELADDQIGGQQFHPETYSAHTLSREIMTRGRIKFEECIDLGIALADALGHLHEQGLIHRDLKPSNIIFLNGRPKLADIGLVISVGESGTMVGTEGFIPPEGPTSPQADIYSFGKILYELSTGNDRNLFPSVPEIVSDPADAVQFSELNEIVTKACAPVPANRYQTATAMRSDLEMLRAGKSVRRLRILEKRLSLLTRLSIGAAALILMALAILYGVNAARQRQKELRAVAYIEGGARLIEEGNYHAALPYFAQALDLQRGDPAAAELQRIRIGMLLRQGVQLLQVWTNAHPVTSVSFTADGKRLFLSQGKSARIWDIASHQPVSPPFETSADIQSAAFNPDESQVLIAARSSAYLFNAVSGTRTKVWRLGAKTKFVTAAAFSPDGKFVALACGGGQAYVHRTDDPPEEPFLSLIGHTDDVDDICFSPTGEMLVTASRDNSARLWDARTGRQIGEPMMHSSWVYHAGFSPNGTRVITTSLDRSVRVWDAKSQQLALRPMDHRDGVRRASFSPDSTKIVSGGNDETVVLWDAATGFSIGARMNHDKPVMDVAFDQSGRRLATADHGGTIKIWDIEAVPATDIGDVHFSEDAARYVAISNNSTFSIYATRSNAVVAKDIPLDHPVAQTFVAHAGERLLFVANNGAVGKSIAMADARSGFRPGDWLPLGNTSVIEPSPDGRFLFVVDTGKKLSYSLWDMEAGRRIVGPSSAPLEAGVVFTTVPTNFAVLGNKDLQFLQTATGTKIGKPLPHERRLMQAHFGRDGTRLLVGSQDETFSACNALVWDFRSGKRFAGPFEHDDGVLDARFNTDETLVVTASEDQYARVWSVATGQLLMRSERHGEQVRAAQFSPDGRAVMTLAGSNTVRIIETATGYPLAAPMAFDEMVMAVGFFPDGRSVWIRLRARTLVVELVRVSETFAQLKEIIGALGTSQIMHGRGAWSAADAASWRRAADRIVDPARLQNCLDDLPRWHQLQAQKWDAKGNGFAARFHRLRLKQLAPTNSASPARLVVNDQRPAAAATTP